MLSEFECPKCNGHLCEIWGLNGSTFGIRANYWHYILNPGLAVNELILGQRLPKYQFVCKACPLPLSERSYVHCDNCDQYLSGKLWAGKAAFANWLGYICPSCGAEIPCLWNVSSRILLTLSAPIWWIPFQMLKPRLLLNSRNRTAQITQSGIANAVSVSKPVRYWKMGLSWGLLMTIFMGIWSTFSTPGILSLSVWSILQLLFFRISSAFPFFVIGGVIFALIMRFTLERKGDESLHLKLDEKDNG